MEPTAIDPGATPAPAPSDFDGIDTTELEQEVTDGPAADLS